MATLSRYPTDLKKQMLGYSQDNDYFESNPLYIRSDKNGATYTRRKGAGMRDWGKTKELNISMKLNPSIKREEKKSRLGKIHLINKKINKRVVNGNKRSSFVMD